jgi:hypothetical protein
MCKSVGERLARHQAEGSGKAFGRAKEANRLVHQAMPTSVYYNQQNAIMMVSKEAMIHCGHSKRNQEEEWIQTICMKTF